MTTSINLVFDGNSLTNGPSFSNGETYAEGLYHQLRASYNIGNGFANYAVSNQSTTNMLSDATTTIDVAANLNLQHNICLVMEGINDIYFGATAVGAYTNLVTYCKARQLAGFKVVIGTLTPRQNAGCPPTQEADRLTVNELIRANWRTFANGLADVAAIPEIGEFDRCRDTVYYWDLVHLAPRGYTLMQQCFFAAISKLLPSKNTAPYPHLSKLYFSKGDSFGYVIGSACAVVSLEAINTNAATRYIQIFDRSASIFVGVPATLSYPIAPGASISINYDLTLGRRGLDRGLAWAFSSTLNTYTAVSGGDCRLQLTYA